MVADSRGEMGFAQSDAAINEKRIVFLARLIRDGQRRRMGELVACAYDKLGKRISRIQIRMKLVARLFGGRYRRRGCPMRICAVAIAAAVSVTITAAVSITIAVGVSITVTVLALTQSELDVDRLTDLGRERLPQKFEVLVGHVVAKEAVGHLDRCSFVLQAEEVERADPGFISDLPKRIAHAIGSLLPHSVHSFPLHRVKPRSLEA